MGWLSWKRPDGTINWMVIPVFIGIVFVAFLLREAFYYVFHH